jgi:hypothetical protein
LLEAERRAHEKSLGRLERLLTALMSEVLPRDSQEIKLKLETKRGSPSLDIVVSQNGEDEDVLRGRGGSVANVLSAGLRFIAIARSKCLPFIVLDEADCWLEADRVPLFFKVVSELSGKLGVQVLFISHYPEPLTPFKVSFTRKPDPSGSNSVVVTRPVFPPSPSGHIRGIRLINVMSHSDTYIPLHPQMTQILAGNDVGKSAVTEAILAVVNDESADTIIRHGAAKAVVQFEMGDGRTVTWERVRKGSPKVMYRLTDAHGASVREGSNADGVPEWAAEALGIYRLDGLDVQVRSQANSIFLLDEPGHVRASILSIGRESGYLKEVRELWKVRLAEAGRAGKGADAESVRLAKLIPLLDTMELGARLGGLKNFAADVERQTAQILAIRAAWQVLALRTTQARVFESLPAAPTAPTLRPTEVATQFVRAAEIGRRVGELPAAPTAPTLRPTEVATQFVRAAEIGRRVGELPAAPTAPTLRPTEVAVRLQLNLVSLKGQVEECGGSIETAGLEAQELGELLVRLGICPICGGST